MSGYGPYLQSPFLRTVERSEFSVSKSDGPFEGIKVTVDDFDCSVSKLRLMVAA